MRSAERGVPFVIGSGVIDSEAWIPGLPLYFVPLQAEDDEQHWASPPVSGVGYWLELRRNPSSSARSEVKRSEGSGIQASDSMKPEPVKNKVSKVIVRRNDGPIQKS
jgi:hypothetical protein